MVNVAIADDLRGDLNIDGAVNAADVSELYSIIIGGPKPTTDPLKNDTIGLDGVEFEMIAVEGGTFKMGYAFGNSDTQPVHRVTLSSFKICKIEVTQEQWAEVMGYNNSEHKGAKFPVTNVTWDEVQTFIRELNSLTGHNFRLPTEAEWEFAARGGNLSQGYTYSGSNTLKDVGWYNTYNYSWSWDTKSGAQKMPNELGIYDMSGNVDEWCSDWYRPYEAGQQTNPTGPETGTTKVYRGGNHANNSVTNGPHTVYSRKYKKPDESGNYTGFRLVLID